ncbi:hypothetical protein A33M_4252 [Rhodovulum sp. PH10]|uniref:CBS domain-containing protein n=1 Tax=Rhodovulum sp. PH10 TaxID=1187851 RepID=UPI00027C2BA7|nr:CBS domain-containing protein [Rhodovulum sp. PH10]EJW10565.1 hypothetical protein A33M_4252 [Rhodovulum sp. PH10]
MKASDIMTTDVVTAAPTDTVHDVAKKLLEHRIGGLPVVDERSHVVGMIGENDLLRRAETGTDHTRSGWLQFLLGHEVLAAEFVKEHGRRVSDVMSVEVATATPDTPVGEIARLLERHRVTRVPIVDASYRLVGIVTCADLVRMLAAETEPAPGELAPDEPAARAGNDAELRKAILKRLEAEPWISIGSVDVTVVDGTADVWGMVDSVCEKRAARVAVETTPGVKAVHDDSLAIRPAVIGA